MAAAWLGLLGVGGCVGSDGDALAPQEIGELSQEVLSANGLSTNGLSTNGLSTNGLSTNGLSTNGLSTNGLAATSFSTWFNGNASVAYSDMVMRYVVACALPAGQTRVWTNPVTGVTYSWPGRLGLATAWAQGAAATVAEQQRMSACLAAHVNKYGVSVPLSLQGQNSAGVIPMAANEATDYPEKEACFFGNLFTGEGVFVGNDRNLTRSESTPRGCALSAKGAGENTGCAPLQHVGMCASVCTRSATHGFWERCVVNGVSYQALTTRLRAQDIFNCGDGVCQFTESCGMGKTYDSCGADCSTCGAP
ncbi:MULTISPECIES: hypothetical protein [unclassified Corallococcus]|uniref:hypothetical protein n=1 Tax=unclassified Corallococcus TaxID=2685029 RepID=UPI001A90C47D|nr:MULTISPECIES: hypothetical protein [unclassified Corallococcus]MBN9687077.1 hypothetical protein [Corallococcus sp. NCSPR001]WAS89094.1 hypothetical protein O0N60_19445 [Corallococcus sp. NCRR]